MPRLDSHGLRGYLAFREISPKGTRCPVPRYSTAVMAALALGNTASPAQAYSPLAGPLPEGLDIVQLLRMHLLDCLNSGFSAENAGLLKALLTVVKATSAGRLHPRVALYLRAARPIPLHKRDEGVRPIALGENLRRLVAKWLLTSAQGRNAAVCFPLCRRFRQGERLRGRGDGGAGQGGRPAREQGVDPAAGGPEERLQLH